MYVIVWGYGITQLMGAIDGGILCSTGLGLISFWPLVKYLAYLRKMTRYNPTRGGTSQQTPLIRQRA